MRPQPVILDYHVSRTFSHLCSKAPGQGHFKLLCWYQYSISIRKCKFNFRKIHFLWPNYEGACATAHRQQKKTFVISIRQWPFHFRMWLSIFIHIPPLLDFSLSYPQSALALCVIFCYIKVTQKRLSIGKKNIVPVKKSMALAYAGKATRGG